MSASRKSKLDREREKCLQDRLQVLLTQMLKDEDNKYCVDCDSKGDIFLLDSLNRCVVRSLKCLHLSLLAAEMDNYYILVYTVIQITIPSRSHPKSNRRLT